MRAKVDSSADAAKAHRDEGFAAAESATLDASLAATPTQRLEWLEEAQALAWASGAFEPLRPPAGWSEDAPAPAHSAPTASAPTEATASASRAARPPHRS